MERATIVNELLAKALQCEDENQLEKCEQYYLQALAEYPDDKDVLCYVAIALFKKGDYEQALDLFVKCYSHPAQGQVIKDDVLNQIIVAYYQPNEESLKNTYEKNVQDLLSYEHNYIESFMSFEELPFLCIPRNDIGYYIFEKNTKKFKEVIILDQKVTSYTNVKTSQCIVAVNTFDPLQIQGMVEQTQDPAWINNMTIPIYLICKNITKMHQYLQLVDYKSVLTCKRVVFFFEGDKKVKFEEFLADHQAYIPDVILGEQQYLKPLSEEIENIVTLRMQDLDNKKRIINQQVQQYNKQYYKDLFAGSYENIRILFYTCRFTQVVQYATRDFMRTCKSLGIQCEIVIEKSDIHRANEMELVDKIAKFNPNIIFRVNFFKTDLTVIPDNIMFITWIQDLTVQIGSYRHAQGFKWNDFALVYSDNWREKMIKTGYDGSRLAVQINPIDEAIFHTRQLSSAEKDFYTADIAFPGNYQSPEKELAALITTYTADLISSDEKSKMADVLISTYELFRSKIADSELILKVEQCETAIREMAILLDLKIDMNQVTEIGQKFFHPLLYNLHRKITVKWLIDEGFNIKLWGRGWETDPDFKPYAMGLLAHGDELAKMYSCTKLVPTTFFWFTAHARSWESTSCGALGMSRYVPAEVDFANIREVFTENEDFIFYYDREDLINKVKYYLDNENERKRIAQSGRQKVLQTMTYSSAVNKCLALIKDNMMKESFDLMG